MNKKNSMFPLDIVLYLIWESVCDCVCVSVCVRVCVCVIVCVWEREKWFVRYVRVLTLALATFDFFLRKGSESSREVLGQQSENILTYVRSFVLSRFIFSSLFSSFLPFDRAPVLGVTYFNRKSNYHRVRYQTRWILNKTILNNLIGPLCRKFITFWLLWLLRVVLVNYCLWKVTSVIFWSAEKKYSNLSLNLIFTQYHS